jgi:hypothetical protein
MNIDGATNSIYTVTSAVPGDAGTYRVNVANAAPSSAMSDPAIVVVNADTSRPVLVSAVGTTNPATINLRFSEAISVATGGSTANYSIVPVGGGAALMVNTATVNGSNIVLNTAPRASSTSYQITITGLRDTSSAGNFIDPNPTMVPLQQDVVIFSWTASWSYFTNTCLDGETWQAPGYDASAWLTGPGLFGLDPDGNGTNVTAQLGLSIMTPLEVGTNRLGYYFRKSFDWGFGTAGVQFLLNHFIDDGAAVFVNGSLSVLINQTNPPPLSCTNLSTGGPGEVALMQTNLTGVASGNNLIAVQVFQSSATSSDVVFGAELIARVTQFGAQGPRLTITIEPNGTQARIQWNPVQGTLQFKNNLEDPAWMDVAGGTTGNIVVNLDQLRRFYTCVSNAGLVAHQRPDASPVSLSLYPTGAMNRARCGEWLRCNGWCAPPIPMDPCPGLCANNLEQRCVPGHGKSLIHLGQEIINRRTKAYARERNFAARASR